MPSLGQLYNDKESGLTTRKTYNVPIASIYAEEGYNVRELNQAHVDEFRDAFIAGEYIPPLAVEVTERGVKVSTATTAITVRSLLLLWDTISCALSAKILLVLKPIRSRLW